MSVKIIINKASKPGIVTPGIIHDWNMQQNDLSYSEGRILINAIVVHGNNVYRNGTKLTLYLDPSTPNLTMPKPSRFLQ